MNTVMGIKPSIQARVRRLFDAITPVFAAALPVQSMRGIPHSNDSCTRLSMKPLWLLFAVLIPLLAQANDPPPDPETLTYFEPYQEFDKRLKAAREVGPLGGDTFGENVSLYNGSTEFSVVDLAIPGNSELAVEVRRRLKIEDPTNAPRLPGFNDWQFDVPHMVGTFTQAHGWKVGEPGSSTDQRCSNALAPTYQGINFDIDEIWHGTHLHIPGRGDEEVLKALTPGFPQLTGGNAPWITKSLVRFECKSTLNNPGSGRSGEGFIAITPDGVRYTLDHMIIKNTTSVQKSWLGQGGGGGGQQFPVSRVRVWLMVTRIEDRFGNRVNYTWTDDRLTGIQSDGVGTADDNRTLTISYTDGQVSSILASGTPSRTVSYAYVPASGGPALHTVTLPDASTWVYQYAAGGLITQPGGLTLVEEPNVCPEPSTAKGDFTYVITHPSKLSGTFQFTARRNYRAVQTRVCESEGNGAYQVLQFPNYSDNFALLSKTFTGPAQPQEIWSYDYGSVPIIVPCTGCADFKTVTVTEPDGAKLENDFGVVFDDNEGRLLRERTRSPSGTVLTSKSHAYPASEPPVSGPYPDRYGESFVDSGDRTSVRVRPLQSTAITQQGVTFTHSQSNFDVYARARTHTKSSNGTPAFSKTETISFHDDLDIWVLHQEASRSVNGIAVHSTGFDPTTARPISVSEYGRLDRTMTWHSDGNLHLMRDALNRAFTLTNYERGVAKSIQLPTGPITTATVDSFGNLTSVTDATGFTTSYQYDGRDRLKRIDYPDADSVAWAPTTVLTAPSTSEAHGIPAGLWKRTETTGSKVQETWFDGRWRPILTKESASDGSTTPTFVRRAFDHRNREVFVSYPADSGVANFLNLNQGVTTRYDALDRVTGTDQDSEIGLLTTSTIYDLGFETRFTDARGFVTRTRFQAYDSPANAWPREIVAALGQPIAQTTEITRDVFGKPERIRRSGSYIPPVGAPQPQQLDRHFIYDANQRLCKSVEPETGGTLIDYDSVNQIAWTAIGQSSTLACDRNSALTTQRSFHTYDAMRRLTGINHPDGTTDLGYTYFADGALATASNTDFATPANSNTWTYTYNKRRLLESESLAYNNRTFNIAHAYNALAHRQSLTYPSGQSVAFQPDARGRARQVGTYASNVTRHPGGMVSAFAYGNGIAHSTSINLRQLPLRRIAGNAMDHTYTYDANGNMLQLVDGLNIGTQNFPNYAESRTLSFDALNRMFAADAPFQFGPESYVYDALDNVRRASLGSAVFDYTFNAQQRLTAVALSGAPYLTYEHNEQGDALFRRRANNAPDLIFASGFEATFPQRAPTYAKDADRAKNADRATQVFRQPTNFAPDQTYTYDRAHRLMSVTNIERYVYDAHGRRIATIRATDSARRYQVYDKSGQLVHSEDQRNNEASDYLHLDGDLIAERKRNLISQQITIQYHHPDTRQSASIVSDSVGNVIERDFFAPYGSPYSGFYQEGPGYAGHVTDSNTGLTYMQQRYYDPIALRFLSPDPMPVDPGTAWNFNRYNYAAGNPYKFVDPDGRYIEAGFEAASLAIGTTSAINNLIAENYEDAAIDTLGVVGDGLLAIVPFAPGTIGLGIQASRYASEIALGPISFYAKNGVGNLYSPNVVLSNENLKFTDFAVGTERGLMGIGKEGATELIGPMRQLIKFAETLGAKTVTFEGKYATEEGAKLGGGKVGESFSFTFPASEDGFKELIGQLKESK